MHRLLTAVAAFMLVVFIAGAQTQAIVRSVNGRVEVAEGSGPWRPVAAGALLPLGATISTGFQSDAVLELGSSVVQVRPLTRMRVDELAEREGTATTGLYLRVGRVEAEVKTTAGLRHDFKLRSPISTAAVRGTRFRYDGANVKVREGWVYLANANNQGTTVGEGEEGDASGDDPPKGGESKKEEQSTVNPYTGRGGGGVPTAVGPTTGSVRITITLF